MAWQRKVWKCSQKLSLSLCLKFVAAGHQEENSLDWGFILKWMFMKHVNKTNKCPSLSMMEMNNEDFQEGFSFILVFTPWAIWWRSLSLSKTEWQALGKSHKSKVGHSKREQWKWKSRAGWLRGVELSQLTFRARSIHSGKLTTVQLPLCFVFILKQKKIWFYLFLFLPWDQLQD